MTWLMMAGGAPMIVIVVFGLVAVLASAHFAWRPRPEALYYIGALCLAVLFSIFAAVAGDLIEVCVSVAGNPDMSSSPQVGMILVEGLGESLSPAVLGFSVLSIVSLISAVGLRRLPTRA